MTQYIKRLTVITQKLNNLDTATGCRNALVVIGNKQHLKKFKSAVRSKYELLSFDKLLPIPRDLLKCSVVKDVKEIVHDREALRLLNKYGASDWYSWCLQNWGTPFDPYNIMFYPYYNNGALFFAYSTTDTPPVQWLLTMRWLWRSLKFINLYYNEKQGIAGVVSVTDHIHVSAQYQRSDKKLIYNNIVDLVNKYDYCSIITWYKGTIVQNLMKNVVDTY